MTQVSIRDYERKELPLEQRLTSLARRFPSLKDADGISPFEPDNLKAWVLACDKEAGVQSGLLMLQLGGVKMDVPFDVLSAMACWSDEDRQMFVNFLRIWDF